MKIEIRTRGLTESAALRERVRRRVRLALGRYQDRIGRVSISLEAVEGAGAGPDKRCRIRLSLSGGAEPLWVEDLDHDAFLALERASERLGRSVARCLGRGEPAAAEASRSRLRPRP